MADGICGGPEIGVRERPVTLECKVQVLVRIEERPVRVVEEIVAGETELQLPGLRLSESEVLENGQVSVKETGTRQCWENIGALLPRRYKR